MPRQGPRRQPIAVRTSKTEREAIEARAAVETADNVSEWTRRALSYAVQHMPAGWAPEPQPSTESV